MHWQRIFGKREGKEEYRRMSAEAETGRRRMRRKARESEARKKEARKKEDREKRVKVRSKRQKTTEPALALWALLAGSSIYKILTVLAGMAIAEVLLFRGCIKTAGDALAEYRSLTAAVESSHISLVFLGALGLVYFILVWTQGRLASKSSGTMLRLRLSGSRIFRIKAGYNAACLVLLFAVQIWLCIWLVGEYERAAEGYASPLSLFLAFYRIDFLHCLLPMAEAAKWVRNVLLLSAFAVEAAAVAGKAAEAERAEYVPAILLYTLTAGWFVIPLGGTVIEWFSIICYLFVTVVNIWRVYKGIERRCRPVGNYDGKNPRGGGNNRHKARIGGKQGELWRLENYFPPGYEYKRERDSVKLLMGIGMGLSLQFFIRLHQAAEALYEYKDRERVLREGALAAPFWKLVTGHWGLYVPLFLFLAAMMVYHYIYYYRGAKSIYLMRRLPGRRTVLKSCVAGPLLGMVLAAVTLVLLYLMYYGIYLLKIPEECRAV